LLDGTRTDDRRGHTGPGQQPGQREVGRVDAQFGGELLVAFDRLPVPFQRVSRPALAGPGAGALALFAQRPAEQSTVQRRPRNDAEAVVDRGRHHFQLDVTGHQVVDALLADQAEEVAAGGRLLCRGQVPAGEVGRTDVQHLALLDEQLHGLPDLLPRRAPGDVVHLVQVDPVGLQPA
jgi:hypothetical protein